MGETYHFIGIGGAGMSGLARLALARGIRVTGSDLRPGPVLQALEAEGATIRVGHDAVHVIGAARVVYTTALPDDNPELLEARRRGIPTVARARLLGEWMADRRGIAVAGTHGKTTTTAMVSAALVAAGADPTVLLGGDWHALGGTNTRCGRGEWFVAEACEAFNSFLEIRPYAAIVTNIEADHLETHGSPQGYLDAFRRFTCQVAPDGILAGCGDDANVRAIAPTARCRFVSYGFGEGLTYRARAVVTRSLTPRFELWRADRRLARVRLAVPGRHNVLNATGAFALALELGVDLAAAVRGIEGFRGVDWRFQRLGSGAGIDVFDDYAHHPTEIRATLSAAREALGRAPVVVFQPHEYSRTRDFMDDFAASFADAARLWLLPVYEARGRPIPGADSGALAERIQRIRPGLSVEVVDSVAEAAARVLAAVRPGEAVFTIGAGADVRRVGADLARALEGAHS